MAQQSQQMFQSTPLDQLTGDGDPNRVNSILSDLNMMGSPVHAGQGQQQQQQHQIDPRGYPEAPRIISEPPVTMSPGQFRMDSVPPQANIIGGARPTMEDFRSMMNPAPSGMTSFQPFRPPGAEEVYLPGPSGSHKNADWRAATTQFLRAPIAVAVIVFLLNLPVVTGLLSRYAVWMYLSSGEISMSGLLVKAMLGACLFGLYQTGVTLWEKN